MEMMWKLANCYGKSTVGSTVEMTSLPCQGRKHCRLNSYNFASPPSPEERRVIELKKTETAAVTLWRLGV